MSHPYFFPAITLPRAAHPHPGSFTRVLYAPVEDIATFPEYDALYCEAAGLPLLKPSRFWYQGALLRKGYREEKKEAAAGGYVETTVRAFLAFDDKRNSKSVDNMKHLNYILIVEHCRRFCRIVGTPDNPAPISFIFDTGDQYNDIAGTSLTWSWRSEDRPMICSRMIPDGQIHSITPYGGPVVVQPPSSEI